MNQVQSIILMIVPLMFSIILHEVSHGWVAEKLGDPTARLMGRLTLNPIPHIDLVGTILIPGILLLAHTPFLFGWAKPVPVNFGNLRGGRRDMALVALAGPVTNLLLAVLSAIVYHLTSGAGTTGVSGAVVLPIHAMAYYAVLLNLVLMVFNLLPILPLDGGRIAVGLLPESIAIPLQRTERWGMLIVLLFIVSDLWKYVVAPVIYVFLRILGMKI
ncbi:MAG: site-2 protease family protein [Deltaproteobacteria bacterium]|jgi:Zn-dependent protease|nr:site-2 protease family protein [Deltaproteobacteria bacterium]MDA8306868.1 site-2 protease family protein [Deltaproteobacteria bacterium]